MVRDIRIARRVLLAFGRGGDEERRASAQRGLAQVARLSPSAAASRSTPSACLRRAPCSPDRSPPGALTLRCHGTVPVNFRVVDVPSLTDPRSHPPRGEWPNSIPVDLLTTWQRPLRTRPRTIEPASPRRATSRQRRRRERAHRGRRLPRGLRHPRHDGRDHGRLSAAPNSDTADRYRSFRSQAMAESTVSADPGLASYARRLAHLRRNSLRDWQLSRRRGDHDRYGTKHPGI